MDSIADAIVYAAAYISCREESDDIREFGPMTESMLP